MAILHYHDLINKLKSYLYINQITNKEIDHRGVLIIELPILDYHNDYITLHVYINKTDFFTKSYRIEVSNVEFIVINSKIREKIQNIIYTKNHFDNFNMVITPEGVLYKDVITQDMDELVQNITSFVAQLYSILLQLGHDGTGGINHDIDHSST